MLGRLVCYACVDNPTQSPHAAPVHGLAVRPGGAAALAGHRVCVGARPLLSLVRPTTGGL